MDGIQNLKNQFETGLEGLYPSEEISSFFYLLTEAYLSLSRLEVALHRDRPINREEQLLFKQAIERLKAQEPIQYIIGATEFFGLRIELNNETLIPRPETEELVNWILKDCGNAKKESHRILDIGTGSGAIALALAQHLPMAEVHAVDISEGAITMAKHNAELNQLGINVHLMDIHNPYSLAEEFDIIVSNPPYVRELEKTMMNSNVLEHEPPAALFVPDGDPFVFYRAISVFAEKHLKTGGNIYLEINEYLSKELIQYLESEGFDEVTLRSDIFGKDRMIRCSYEKTH